MIEELNDEIETLVRLPEIIAKFIRAVPEAGLDIKRNESTWTIREHFLHIVQVQAMLLGRIKLIKESDNPKIEPYFPENDSIKVLKIEDAIEVYRDYRKKQIAEIKSCTTEDLQRTAEHREYTEYSIPIIIKHMIFHEYWHMYRIEEILYTKDEYFK